MKTTLSCIKADIGSIGGHIVPSKGVLNRIREHIGHEGEVRDHFITYTGDDVSILISHHKGAETSQIHQLAWDAFQKGTEVAKEEGLYGAGQDLLSDAFSGNVRGLGPAVAEMEFEERPNEPFLLFMADKTEPGAYNLPLYLTFADPMYNSGLILSPKMEGGFTFTIMDVEYTEGERTIELNSPEDIYDIACLLRDNHRFVVKSISSRKTGQICVACSTTRLSKIAGKYVGKDDPVMLIRVQSQFPSSGEVLAPYQIGHYVGGFMRGSHTGPLMPAKSESAVSYFDGPPMVSCLGFCVHEGKLTEPVDVFDHPLWDQVRDRVTQKAIEMRKQGFSGPAMLGYQELEYGGITERMDKLEEKFEVTEN